MSADPVAYLRARIDEDEEAARAAERPDDPTALVWSQTGARTLRFDNGRSESYGSVTCGTWDRILVARDDVRGFPLANHIARWDPVAVLADLAAKRRILERHSGVHICPQPQDPHWVWYIAGERVELTYPCGDVLDLLQPYAARGDFDPSWRTSG
jgi:hypothetical protein